jgi:hypothetical protein
MILSFDNQAITQFGHNHHEQRQQPDTACNKDICRITTVSCIETQNNFPWTL